MINSAKLDSNRNSWKLLYIRSSYKFMPTFVYTHGDKRPMHLSLADREQARADFRGYKIVI